MHCRNGNPLASGYLGAPADFLRLLEQAGIGPAVVYDIGASTGVWSEAAAGVFPDAEFHLFEPLAELAEPYRADLGDRRRRFPAFHVHSVALGRENGRQRLFVTKDFYGSSLLYRGALPEVLAVMAETLDVAVHSLDGFQRAHNLPLPDLIKADCQGAELAILGGAERCLSNCRALVIETWLSREYGPDTPLLSEVSEWLGERDFSLVGLGETFLDSQHRIYSVDSYFISDAAIEAVWPDAGGGQIRRLVLAGKSPAAGEAVN